nr:RHS domain-containing protein [Vibrio cholerae]
MVQSGQTYQVHVDHLGTPKALTDTSGQMVWKASHHRVGRERYFLKSIVL